MIRIRRSEELVGSRQCADEGLGVLDVSGETSLPVTVHLAHSISSFVRGFRQRTWYCAPMGRRETSGSMARSGASILGKMKRKSVRTTSTPASRTRRRASFADSVTASRSNGIRLITHRVPGFHGLFSHNAK